jgi:hypothetical protein
MGPDLAVRRRSRDRPAPRDCLPARDPGPRWGRIPPEDHGQQRRATVSWPRRSAAIFERSLRSSEHPDCLSHGGSRLGSRSALGPCHNGRARAWAVTSGRPRFEGIAGRGPFGSSSWDNADGRFGLWSRRSGALGVRLATHSIPAVREQLPDCGRGRRPERSQAVSAAQSSAATSGFSKRKTPRWVPSSGKSNPAMSTITPKPGARTMT